MVCCSRWSHLVPSHCGCVHCLDQLVKICYETRLKTVLQPGAASADRFGWCKRIIYITRSIHASLMRDNGIPMPIPDPRPGRARLMMRVAAYALKQGMPVVKPY